MVYLYIIWSLVLMCCCSGFAAVGSVICSTCVVYLPTFPVWAKSRVRCSSGSMGPSCRSVCHYLLKDFIKVHMAGQITPVEDSTRASLCHPSTGGRLLGVGECDVCHPGGTNAWSKTLWHLSRGTLGTVHSGTKYIQICIQVTWRGLHCWYE